MPKKKAGRPANKPLPKRPQPPISAETEAAAKAEAEIAAKDATRLVARTTASARRSFRAYKADGAKWVALAPGEYYPDGLAKATRSYGPHIVRFGELLDKSETSIELFKAINTVKPQSARIQLLRVFKRYVCHELPVEMTKKVSQATDILREFGDRFRPMAEVRRAFRSRPSPDETLSALLAEYGSRGDKGYALTEAFFDLIRRQLPGLKIIGPERAGRDVLLGEIFPDYPNPGRPVDFVVYDDVDGTNVLAIGFARFDSDRGGAQEDDRTGGYNSATAEILAYYAAHSLGLKVVFLNDGPGLLLGSMWNDYSALEEKWPGQVMVVTLRMVPERLTLAWLRG